MNINITLFGQMITFLVFVWFTMKFVWPPIIKALHERQQKIADGLAAAEQGKRELEEAKAEYAKTLQEAKAAAAHIVEQANGRAQRLVEEAQIAAREEKKRLLAAAEQEVAQQYHQAKQKLRDQLATLAMAGAQAILETSLDEKMHRRVLDKFVAQI